MSNKTWAWDLWLKICQKTNFQQVVAMAQQCCSGDSAQVYVIQVQATPQAATEVDSQALGTRKCLAMWNAGPNVVEVAPNLPSLTFGNGFPIPVSAPLILMVQPNVKHYACCAAGLASVLRCFEIGVSDVG